MVTKEELVRMAMEARNNAYCPYSNYMVGAAVLASNGKVYTGCNIENASYGLTVCAERVALFKMVSEGCRTFEAIAVATGDPGKEGPPCLACRQVMTEFCANFDVPIYDCSPDGSVWEHTLREMAPYPFTSFDKNQDYHD